MQTKALEIERSVFDFLNGIISDYGLYIFMAFVFLLIPFTIWALSGGLRRKLLKGKPAPHVPPVIVIQVHDEPPPPTETFDPFPPLRNPPDGDRDEY
jgi:hypothetical protein